MNAEHRHDGHSLPARAFIGSVMKRRLLLVLALLCSSAPVSAEQFDDALRRARASEAALEPGQMVRLVDAQGAAMQKALTRCTPRRETIPDSFAVVFRIDEGDRVAASWTRSESEFEQCFAAAMSEMFHYAPPIMPFYTSIDYRRSKTGE
jgi:hypothetical protein